jgi:hypothetical protein
MNRSGLLTVMISLALATPAFGMAGASLKGSPASMVRQNRVAKANDFSFLRTPEQVERFVEDGYLVPVQSKGSLRVNGGVSYPVARPEMKLFLERLAEQYEEGCGEKLVVTSLVRPTSEQPRNSHPLSVHPAGMAADLRISSSKSCRSWLESTLLSLESRELLDVTRERYPPHYHVALFPDRYAAYVAPMIARDSSLAAAAARDQAERLAMASLRHAAAPLVATAATSDRPAAPDRGSYALLTGVLVVFGALGVRRLVSRRAAAE